MKGNASAQGNPWQTRNLDEKKIEDAVQLVSLEIAQGRMDFSLRVPTRSAGEKLRLEMIGRCGEKVEASVIEGALKTGKIANYHYPVRDPLSMDLMELRANFGQGKIVSVFKMTNRTLAEARQQGQKAAALKLREAWENTKRQYVCAAKDLESAKAKRIYQKLFMEITPSMQMFLGYCRYERNDPVSQKDGLYFLSSLLIQVRHAGFVLENGAFRPNTPPQEWTEEQTARCYALLAQKYPDSGALETYIQEITELCVRLREEQASLAGYESCQRIIEALGNPAARLKEIYEALCAGGAGAEQTELLKLARQIRAAYDKGGAELALEFKFYEDFWDDPAGAKDFYVGGPGRLPYPGLYGRNPNGGWKIYLNLAGRRMEPEAKEPENAGELL